jgi:LL-diaminopimelate aminotransferase
MLVLILEANPVNLPSSKKVDQLPPYLFARINEKKRQLMSEGVDIIDLGIGDPDIPTPTFIVDRLVKELANPENMRYSAFSGCDEYREAVAYFYKKEYGVELDPKEEVLTLIGSKEGIAHLILAYIDEGDAVLVPDPSYPVYRMATILSNGVVHEMPLLEEKAYQPDYEDIPKDILKKAKIGLLNYPSNPTGASVDLDFFEKSVEFFKANNLILAHDAAYQLVTFDDYKAPSILQVPGAKEVAVEFGSLSKSFNMTGWRIGFVVGNREVIRKLATVKSNLDTSQFLPIQKAGATALTTDLDYLKERNEIYKQRMLLMVEALKEIGINTTVPRGGIFLWAKVPDGFHSSTFAEKMLEKAGVVVTPGTAFGEAGEGYFRISVSVPDDRLREAVERIKQNL